MTLQASNPCQAGFASASEPHGPSGSTPQGAPPAQATIPAIWSGSKGHPEGNRVFRHNVLRGVFPVGARSSDNLDTSRQARMGLRAVSSFPLGQQGFSNHQLRLSFSLSVCAEVCIVLLLGWSLTAVGIHPRPARNSSACLFLACMLQVDLVC